MNIQESIKKKLLGEKVSEKSKKDSKKDKDEKVQYRLPFGGGSGATVSINPIAFLIVEEGKVRLLPVSHSSCIDKILDYVPDLFEKLSNNTNKLNFKKEYKKEEEKPKSKKVNINKVPKTTQENLEYKPNKIKSEEDKEIAEELEDLFKEEYDYDDD